ncbi:diguanylate cyclase domain-containing protein [Paracoccus tegillarcae]|uniref:diguanylate cyclase n=1 Tax=Paracoccus tegillarcae TaxID=1529068 RepID=A0A2K9EXU5_9RHOB|nr:diguanylate cyclase [Paracoccus tegillarcae]AUH34134.1 diguanylate cyclase response regulator [Paracoccus tegillarcae]
MSGRILIADGLATNRITLKVRLTAACYEVVTATSPQQVCDLAAQQRPDLIILGASLGHDAPVALCHELSRNSATAHIPVLVQCQSDHLIAALKAGATAVLDPRVDENMLLARIRGLLRQRDVLRPLSEVTETVAALDVPIRGDVTLVADTPGRALGWKHMLSQYLPSRFAINDAEQALAAVARDDAAELYVIATDLENPGEGLRLLAELRSRNGSRNSSFIVAVPNGRSDIATIALDLGAGDTMPLCLQSDTMIEATAIAINAQLRQKRLADRRRAEAERHHLWAMTDPLTGLYNRRYALPRLTAIAQDAQRNGEPFSILAMDLDRFKLINDQYGHAAGDAVLVEVAARIVQAISELGMTARVGGEEFVTVLPGIGAERAAQLAELVRQTVMSMLIALPMRLGGRQLSVTLSIGIATSDQCAPTTQPVKLAEDALDRADRAMLAAKSLGRNRVIRATAAQAA